MCYYIQKTLERLLYSEVPSVKHIMNKKIWIYTYNKLYKDKIAINETETENNKVEIVNDISQHISNENESVSCISIPIKNEEKTDEELSEVSNQTQSL